MTAVLLSSACWYLSHQSIFYDRLGMTWVGASCTSVEICFETCHESPKSRYLIFLYSDLMDQFEGSRRFDDHQWNSSATRESSRVIILKSRLNSTGDSACTNEVRDIFDHQTYVPNDWWQLMCTFSNLETPAIQWRRPSVMLHSEQYLRPFNWVQIKLWVFRAILETI